MAAGVQPSIECTTFNPSLVRLARNTRTVVFAESLDFQSQLGSIGAVWNVEAAQEESNFQSQLGSIGASSAATQPDGQAIFQSQLGSIGAPYGLRSRRRFRPFNPSLVRLAHIATTDPSVPGRLFQSQLGSIGAREAPMPIPSSAHKTFNPSLVRLALVGTLYPLLRATSFNPSLVRLAHG